MPENARKIAILGGGPAGLAAAFFLTNDPDWKDRHNIESITIHQMGWRMGGKCASSRNPDACDRIEEHGIHLFGGFYFNTFAMMRAVYEELGRTPGRDPIATIDEAFNPNGTSVIWEYLDRGWKQWNLDQPGNPGKPWDNDLNLSPAKLLTGAFHNIVHQIMGELHLADKTGKFKHLWDLFKAPLKDAFEKKSRKVSRELEGLGEKLAADALSDLLKEIECLLDWVARHLKPLIDHDHSVRRAFLMMDYIATLFRGYIADEIYEVGFDAIDGEDFLKWLECKGIGEETLKSPLPLMNPNILFAYRDGDSSRPPTMGAGGFLHWTFLSFNYIGDFSYMFSAGTGETIIAPIYQVLEKRGVKFEFFQKVEKLHLDADGKFIESVTISEQIEVKGGRDAYKPLCESKINAYPESALVGWPKWPDYDQLVDGDKLKAHDRAGNPSLESYWTSWPSASSFELRRGEEFTDIVLAISVGALREICSELIEADANWKNMIENVQAIQTQAFQIWMDKPITELSRHVPTAGTDIYGSANYLNPTSDFAEMHHLFQWEGWPQANQPGSLVYFCGSMAEDPVPPPYGSDPGYPGRQTERVKWQAAQLLQAAASPMMPGATVAASGQAGGDPAGFDFSLLTCPDPAAADQGNAFSRINQQFFRANIDPTERYVLSIPGSTGYRLAPGNSGFDNLALAGDWTRNGLNVGCVEATVMSAELAAAALLDRDPELRGHGTYSVPGTSIKFV
jgi:uncharacterized protein with NAD-binding domain and iron-sulfur cluster